MANHESKIGDPANEPQMDIDSTHHDANAPSNNGTQNLAVELTHTYTKDKNKPNSRPI